MKKFGQLTEMKLKRFDGVYNRQYSWVNIEQNIRNEGEFPVKGTNYDVVFILPTMTATPHQVQKLFLELTFNLVRLLPITSNLKAMQWLPITTH